MKSHIFLSALIAAFMLSGCETMEGSMRDMTSWGDSMSKTASSTGDLNQSASVRMREDNGAMTPMPSMATPPMPQEQMPMAQTQMPAGYAEYNPQAPAMGTMVNNNVALFDANAPLNYQRGNYAPPPPQPMGSLPSYSGGMVSGIDSSVTIYSVDGAPMMNSGGQMAQPAMDYGYSPDTSNAWQAQNQIFFNHGSSRLGSHDMRKLDNLADQAKFAPVGRVTVAGHASQKTQAGRDTVQSHILNLKQSMNRSFAVSKSLMQKGVPAEKIKTVSWGSTKPSGSPQQDRRVDVIMGEQ